MEEMKPNQREYSEGWYSLIDVTLWFGSLANKEEYRKFLVAHNLKETVYDKSILSVDEEAKEQELLDFKLSTWK